MYYSNEIRTDISTYILTHGAQMALLHKIGGAKGKLIELRHVCNYHLTAA